MPYFRGSHLSFRALRLRSGQAPSRNGASGTSDIDGCAARVAGRESGDERVNLSLLGKAFTMPLKLSDKKLAVLGAGKLGGILLRAYLKHRLFVSGRVTATVRHAERAAALAKELGISVTADNREAVKGADIILLTVKPQTVAEVLQEIAPEIGDNTLLVSVAASVPTSYVEQQLAAASDGKRNDVAVVRAMPNTPAAVGCGMAALCRGAHAGAA